jgi:hypothetical protein
MLGRIAEIDEGLQQLVTAGALGSFELPTPM